MTDTGVMLYKNTVVVSLIQNESGRATDVNAIADDSEIAFTGKAVLLCTSGFGQNPS